MLPTCGLPKRHKEQSFQNQVMPGSVLVHLTFEDKGRNRILDKLQILGRSVDKIEVRMCLEWNLFINKWKFYKPLKYKKAKLFFTEGKSSNYHQTDLILESLRNYTDNSVEKYLNSLIIYIICLKGFMNDRSAMNYQQ
jgi:hypothetical protein